MTTAAERIDSETGEVVAAAILHPHVQPLLIETSPTLGALFGALAEAQGEMRNAAKDSKNPFYRSTYADLASVWEACRGPLSSHGLAVVQVPAMHEGKPALVTILGHKSGEWIRGVYPIRPMRQLQGGGWEDTRDPQSILAAFTYSRRGSLAGMAGVSQGDDDGEMAVGRGSRSNGNGSTHSAPTVEDLCARMGAATTMAALNEIRDLVTDFLDSYTAAQRDVLGQHKEAAIARLAPKPAGNPALDASLASMPPDAVMTAPQWAKAISDTKTTTELDAVAARLAKVIKHFTKPVREDLKQKGADWRAALIEMAAEGDRAPMEGEV